MIALVEKADLSAVAFCRALPVSVSVSMRIARIIECFGLEGAFRGHLAQPPCSEQGLLQLDQVAQSPIQPDLSRDGASATSLGNPFLYFTTLIVKNFFLVSSLNLPSLS